MPPQSKFPDPLGTERLELRAYRQADAAGLQRLIDANRERLLESFKPLARGLRDAAEVQAYIADCAELWQAGRAFFYGIWTRESPALIGQLKIKNIQWEVPSAELSYFIDKDALRRGYAREAVLAVMRHALEALGFRRLYARIIASNVESLKLAQKLGMDHEGVHKSEFRCGYGELHDVHYFSVTRRDG